MVETYSDSIGEDVPIGGTETQNPRPDGSEQSSETANGAAQQRTMPMYPPAGTTPPAGAPRAAPSVLEPLEALRIADLAREREWFQRTKEDIELRSIREAHEAFARGDESGLYRVVTADKMAPSYPFSGGANMLPRPESHSIYQAKNRTNKGTRHTISLDLGRVQRKDVETAWHSL